jgi:hypothetical protein
MVLVLSAYRREFDSAPQSPSRVLGVVSTQPAESVIQ